ncbi:unnamed protein product [Echinostoma caproni]|uniref:RPAP1_N domain-containing protein n=1 Tax=Echinostoma caproni TaxID=27848 RepID=A0A183B7G2_9TREM|nr:unnamed protein product [Echinostoma caproni]
MITYETGRMQIASRAVMPGAELTIKPKPEPEEEPSSIRAKPQSVSPITGAEKDLVDQLTPEGYIPIMTGMSIFKSQFKDILTLLPGEQPIPPRKKPLGPRSKAASGSLAVVTKVGAASTQPKVPSKATSRRARQGRIAQPQLTSLYTDKPALRTRPGVARRSPMGRIRKDDIDALVEATSGAVGTDLTSSSPRTIRLMPERREPPFRFASSFGTTVSSGGPIPEGAINVEHSVGKDTLPEEAQAQTTELVSEQVGQLSTEVHRLSEMEEVTPRATGIWTWLDTLLASQVKSTTGPQSDYQALSSEIKSETSRKVPRVKGDRLINRFEDKGAHLQYLIKNLEDADQWTIHLDADESEIQLEDITSMEEDQTKRAQTLRPSSQLFTSTIPPTQRAKQIRKRLIEKGLLPPIIGRIPHPESDRMFRQAVRSPRESTGLDRFTTDLDYATKYLQSVVPPGRLTLLLNDIQRDETSPDALNALEEALLLAASKAEAAVQEWVHCVTFMFHQNMNKRIFLFSKLG